MTGLPEQQQIILTTATLGPVTLVPEIRLYQAAEPIGVWQHTERATGRTGLDPPFWAFAWAGGQALARYLLDHPEAVAGRRVIDVASGSGLVAIAAIKAGAATITAYDIDPLAAAAIAVNAEANGVTIPAVCADVLSDQDLPAPGTDLVPVADAQDAAETVISAPPGRRGIESLMVRGRGPRAAATRYSRAAPTWRRPDWRRTIG